MAKTDNEWLYEFSGRIIQGMLTNPKVMESVVTAAKDLGMDFEDALAVLSVKYAKRLLARLKKGEV